MKNKKKFIIILISIIVFVLGLVYFIFTKQDKNTSFTLLEKQWLENNKTKVLDISILKDIPVISYNGNGVLFDFLLDLEEVTGLDFNEIAYQNGDQIKSEYSFQVVDQKLDNDILIYSDNYVLLTKTNIKYNKLSEIDNMIIGVLEADLAKVQNAMGAEFNYVPYANIQDLLNAYNQVDTVNPDGTVVDNTPIDAFVIPKLSNLELILNNENMNISYNISEIKQDYVIRLGSNEKLNEIIRPDHPDDGGCV